MKYLFVRKSECIDMKKAGMTLVSIFPREHFVHREGDFWSVRHLDGKDFTNEEINKAMSVISSLQISNKPPDGYSELVFIEHASWDVSESKTLEQEADAIIKALKCEGACLDDCKTCQYSYGKHKVCDNRRICTDAADLIKLLIN